MKKFLFLLLVCVYVTAAAQSLRWDTSGNSYFRIEAGELVRYTLPADSRSVVASAEELTPQGYTQPLKIRNYLFSGDASKLLLFTNTQKVWRLDTRGDYWVLDVRTKSLKQLGKTRP